MRKSICLIITALIIALTPIQAHAELKTGLMTERQAFITVTTYRDGSMELEVEGRTAGTCDYRHTIIKKSKKYNRKKAHTPKKEWGVMMTDVKRINHLFNILAQKKKGTEKDVWAEFVREYNPTKAEKTKLKALYDTYFVNKTTKAIKY